MKSKYSKTTRQLLDEIRQNQLDETITAVKNKATANVLASLQGKRTGGQGA